MKIPESQRSGQYQFHSLIPQSSQYFTVVPDSQEKTDLVGRPIVHKSAYKQATGEAVYCDDIPRQENELYLSLVLSKKAHAKIISIDPSEALAIDGVVAFFSAKDIPKELNHFGSIVQDEEVFISEKVTSQGQSLGAIVAVDQLTAQRANKLVKVVYEDLQPIIVTIEDAIKAKSFFNEKPRVIRNGNPEKIFSSAKNIVEGDIKIGGQEHFYLETHATLAVPKNEDDEIEIFSSTQHPTEIQHQVSHLLNIPSNRVYCHVKRLGGGFGGKESRGSVLALPVAFAAHKLRRPVRTMLDRDEDMISTGQRHPFYGKYKVAFDDDGTILASEVDIYNNAGYSLDLSFSVLDRAMFHFQNSYYMPNVLVRGHACKTNTPSNTAFRGFGGPQGMLIGEVIISHIADKLGIDVAKVRERNLYQENQLTHYNQPLTYCTIRRCWQQCLNDSKFYERRAQIEEFNKQHRWKKRGIAIVPTMFGISFTALFLNQAGALVLIYADGSVLISHGGIEMGQGLHTKMIQVASRALGISDELIHISESATDKVPNTSPTAASAGSDLNGMAVLNACNTINERLKPIKEANPKGTWKDWIKTAYFSRISLAASGFYKTPDIGYNMETNSGMPFNYYTFGVACSEVEIDCLTGDHQVRRTDIVMDVGESLNPAIDIGQIEGAFMQGYGLFTLEELVVSPTGTMYSRGPGAYKLPGFADIPAEFNVSLLKGAPNPRAVYSSKAVGEPPLFLAASIFFAIREAIKSARKDAGLPNEWFSLDSPATAARIRMACKDHITKRFPKPTEGSFTPWNVQL
ncbi:hypothetical protein O3M35_013084 [Rhynocoris fuscipes]